MAALMNLLGLLGYVAEDDGLFSGFSLVVLIVIVVLVIVFFVRRR